MLVLTQCEFDLHPKIPYCKTYSFGAEDLACSIIGAGGNVLSDLPKRLGDRPNRLGRAPMDWMAKAKARKTTKI